MPRRPSSAQIRASSRMHYRRLEAKRYVTSVGLPYLHGLTRVFRRLVRTYVCHSFAFLKMCLLMRLSVLVGGESNSLVPPQGAAASYMYHPPPDVQKGYSDDYPLYPSEGYPLDSYPVYGQVQTQTSELSPIYEGGAIEMSTVSGMPVCVPATGYASFTRYEEEYR